jgi:hypothetical protein
MKRRIRQFAQTLLVLSGGTSSPSAPSTAGQPVGFLLLITKAS